MDRSSFVPPSVEKDLPLSINIIDQYVQQTGLKIEMTFSHFQAESVYFYIRCDTPAGTILADPQKHFSYCMHLDLDGMASAISEGLENNLQKIVTGCMESLFDIEILRYSNDIPPGEIGHPDVEHVEFLFTLTIDMAKILSDTTTNSSVSFAMIVDRATLEEFVCFLMKIRDRHMLYREGHREIFDRLDKPVEM